MFCILIVLLRKFESFIPGSRETVDFMYGIRQRQGDHGVEAGKESVP